MAEDFAPYNINVTTVAPPTIANGVSVRIALAPSADVQQTVTVATETTQQWYDDIAENVERIEDNADGEAQFVLKNTRDGGDLIYTPHYSQHGQRYGIYMNFEVPDSPAAQQAILDESAH